MASRIDEFGTPTAYNHYAVGWAHAMCTPYQWTKQVASHWGGTRNGTIVHWPNGIKAKGEVRHQFHHVIDVAPTVLEVAGLPEPTFVNGVQQLPYEGVSMRYAFDDADAPERHATQYFEMFCNRGIYHNGWTAVTRHSIPWDATSPMPAFDDDVWELYDATPTGRRPTTSPPSMPEKLAELQRLWLIEVVEVQRAAARRPARRALQLRPGRPAHPGQGTTQLLFGGMGRLSENSVLNLKNKSHAVTAEIDVPDGGANGVIIAQGGAFGGWSLYLRDGKPALLLQPVRRPAVRRRRGRAACRPGTHQVRMEFAYDGGGLAKGGTATLFVDGAAGRSGPGRGHRADGLLRRRDGRPRGGHRLAGGRRLPGRLARSPARIDWVQLDVGDDDHDHLISAEERLRVAMSRQ